MARTTRFTENYPSGSTHVVMVYTARENELDCLDDAVKEAIGMYFKDGRFTSTVCPRAVFFPRAQGRGIATVEVESSGMTEEVAEMGKEAVVQAGAASAKVVRVPDKW